MTRRWVCPKCNDGCLAPSRPRKDDARRYCLPCTAKTGRLVERVCPAVDNAKARDEADRKVRQAERAAKRAASRAVAQEQQAVARRQESVAKRALRELPIAELAKLATRQAYEEAAHRYARLKAWEKDMTSCAVEVRLSRDKQFTSGHAWGGNGKGQYTFTAGSDLAGVHATILHELAHLAAPTNCHHGAAWRLYFLAAAGEVVGHRVEAPGNVGAYGDDGLDGIVKRELALFLYGGAT